MTQPPGSQPPPPGQQPPYGQPPAYGQPAYGQPPPGYGPATTRPGSVTAAGVLLIVLGAFAGIGGIFMILGGAFLATADFGEQFGPQFGDIFQAAAGIAVIAGVVVIIYAVFKIIAGAKVFSLRNGWRIAGIVLCAIPIILWILSLISSIMGPQDIPASLDVPQVPTGPNIGGIVIALLFLAANTITLVLLARSGESFRRAP